MPSKPGPSAQARAWHQIDHQLVSLKLRQARKQIDKQFPVPVKIPGAGFSFEKIMRPHLDRARKWTESLYEIYTEVWEKQARARTPDFLMAVLNRTILPAIGASTGNAKHEIEQQAVRRKRSDGLGAIQQALAMEASRLKGEWRTRIEIEVRELQLQQTTRSSEVTYPVDTGAGKKQIHTPPADPTTIRDYFAGGGMQSEEQIYKQRLQKFSLSELRSERDKLENSKRSLIAKYPELEGMERSLTVQYSGGAGKEFAEVVWKIGQLDLELWKRDELTALAVSVEGAELSVEKTPSTSDPWHFEAAPGYRQVEIGGKVFSLTPDQSRVIEMLHDAYKTGRPDVAKRSIFEKLERETSNMRDLFRSTPGAKKALIKKGAKKDLYRLNLPDPQPKA